MLPRKLILALAVMGLAIGASTGIAAADGQLHFGRSVAKKINHISFGKNYQLVCSERRTVSHPDDILKSWKPDFAKASQQTASDKKAFAKLMTAAGIASSKSNTVLYRVELDGKSYHSSHCLLARSKDEARYFAKNFHGFNAWGQSEASPAPYQFHVYELRKPFRQSLKRRKGGQTTVFWNVSVYPQQVFIPAK